jgi:hypothetical protein
MRELVELIEFEYENMVGKTEKRVYEVYEGDFIQTVGDSANGYWYDRRELRPHEELMREATLLVLSDGGLVGYWSSMTEIEEFIRLYLRGRDICYLTKL